MKTTNVPPDLRLCDTFDLSETTLLSIILAMPCMLVYMYILLFVCFHVLISQLYVQRVICHPLEILYKINTFMSSSQFFELLIIRNKKSTVKPVLSNNSKRKPKLVFNTDYRLMQLKSISEMGAFCNTFDLH